MPVPRLRSFKHDPNSTSMRNIKHDPSSNPRKRVQMSIVGLAIFCLGCSLGSYHGQTNTKTWSFGGLLDFAVPSADCGKTSSQLVENKQGWKSIDVFYGNTQDPDNIDRKWYSQWKQDSVVMGLLRNKRDGFFIDLGSNDARKLSNTYALERRFGWRGLCIEPNPRYWFDLSRFRTCKVVAANVGSNRMEEIKFNYRGIDGGINREGFDNGEAYETESIPAFTVPLKEVLERADTPHVIDYLSLDEKGSDTYIMKNFPFSSYRIKIMTVERPDKRLELHLESNGFKNMGSISHFGETLWIHNAFMTGLDLSVLDKVTKKKAGTGKPLDTLV
jgi:hypothetical protein